MAEIRLQKFLSECSVASRRKSEELIRDGKVWVNGKKASIGDKVDPKRDDVTVNGKKVTTVKQKYYIMLNKPRGYVTTMSDELGRKCVAELVADVGATVYPVGRLDRDSEGMLLLTNDGEFLSGYHDYNLVHFIIRSYNEGGIEGASSANSLGTSKTFPLSPLAELKQFTLQVV